MGIQSAASKDLAARQAALEAARQAALEAARAAREAMAAALAALRASLAAQSDQNIGSGSPAEPMPASAIGGSPFTRSAADFDDIDQGRIGDCYFLSTINALNQDPEDRQFLEDAVVVLEDPETGESIYHVSLYDRDGRQVTTEISQDDIDAAKRGEGDFGGLASSADDHVVALQLAGIEMLGASEYAGGGFTGALAMLGVNIEQITITSVTKDLDTALDQIANDPDGAVAVFLACAGITGAAAPVPEGGKPNHMWAITGYDPATQTITYQNPWNTNENYTISKEDFIGLNVYNIQVLNTGLPENSPPDYLWTIKDGSERGQEWGDPLLGELGDNGIMELPEGARSEINQYINLYGLDMSAENDVKQAEEKLTEILGSQYGIEYSAAEVEFAGVNQGGNSVVEVNYRVEAVNDLRGSPISPAQESILINMTTRDYLDFRAKFDPHATEVGAFNLAVYLVTGEVLDQNVERLDESMPQNNVSGWWSMAKGLEFMNSPPGSLAERVEAVNDLRGSPISPAQESILITMTTYEYDSFRAEFDPHASEVGAFNLAVYLVTDAVLDQNVKRLDDYIQKLDEYLQNGVGSTSQGGRQWSMAEGLDFMNNPLWLNGWG